MYLKNDVVREIYVYLKKRAEEEKKRKEEEERKKREQANGGDLTKLKNYALVLEVIHRKGEAPDDAKINEIATKPENKLNGMIDSYIGTIKKKDEVKIDEKIINQFKNITKDRIPNNPKLYDNLKRIDENILKKANNILSGEFKKLKSKIQIETTTSDNTAIDSANTALLANDISSIATNNEIDNFVKVLQADNSNVIPNWIVEKIGQTSKYTTVDEKTKHLNKLMNDIKYSKKINGNDVIAKMQEIAASLNPPDSTQSGGKPHKIGTKKLRPKHKTKTNSKSRKLKLTSIQPPLLPSPHPIEKTQSLSFSSNNHRNTRKRYSTSTSPNSPKSPKSSQPLYTAPQLVPFAAAVISASSRSSSA